MAKSAPDPIAGVIPLLNRYRCPMPYYAVRAYFMGCIASPVLNCSPIDAIRELWDGEFPPVKSPQELNAILQVLARGLWNELAAHQSVDNPFLLSRISGGATKKSVAQFAKVRRQEIEAFVEGLFGSEEEVKLSARARKSVDVLGEIRSMLAGIVELLERPGEKGPREELAGLSDQIAALSTIVETEINTVIVACLRSRTAKATVH